jgi:CHAD domain-containing protein
VSYRFKRREPIARGFARVAREEIEGALADLGAGSVEAPGAEGIHEARRRLKKLRALLRLMRPALGDDIFARDNSIAREAGRALSPARDAAVQLATLDGLLDIFAARATEELSPLRRKIAGAGKRSGQTKRTVVAVDTVIGRLRALLATIEPPPVPDDPALLRESLRRAYRQSRRAFGAATADASDEALHLLRKRVKALQYQLFLMRRAAPKHGKRLLDRLDRLGEDLGADRDLALLATSLTPDARIDAAAVAALRDQIERRRRKLQRQALRLANELFAAKPSAWLKPFARAWKHWHEPS